MKKRVRRNKKRRARINPPGRDRASRALSEKLAARVRAMLKSERAKLDRLLINVELLGDVQRAGKNIGISRELLRKWMNTPEISWAINQALTQAELIAKGEDYTYVPLWWSPEIPNNSRFWAKVASQNLKASRQDILRAIENNNKEFFIDLGKCLSGEIDATLIDQRDAYLAGLLTRYPSITGKDAVDQLTRLGFPRITEENFRMLKKRLKIKVHTVHDHHARRRALHEVAKHLDISIM